MNKPKWWQRHMFQVMLSCVCALTLNGTHSVALAQSASEAEVKAAFLYNFTKFVDWPIEQHSRPLVIGVIGDEHFEKLLVQTIAGERVGSRTLVSKSLTPEEELGDCHVLFVSAAVGSETPAILARVRGKGILTVGEAEDFTTAGGIIGLRVIDRKVRFSVNLNAARISELTISSQLLKLASDVLTAGNVKAR